MKRGRKSPKLCVCNLANPPITTLSFPASSVGALAPMAVEELISIAAISKAAIKTNKGRVSPPTEKP